VDAACQAHDLKGLFVADSSSFCSSGSAPFTLTIMANALRVAAGIAGKMRRREL
jgi:choline dehydrogenase-like flavoprotein